MKVVITGHTSGIGKGFYDLYTSRGYDVQGFSRGTGHDLGNPLSVSAVAVKAVQSDLFINNAYSGTAQVELMYKVHELWKDNPNKTMVVIGSRAPDFLHERAQIYATMKGAIDVAAEQLTPFAKYHLLNVKPSFTRTAMLPARLADSKSVIEVDPLINFVDSIIFNKSFRVTTVTIDPNPK